MAKSPVKLAGRRALVYSLTVLVVLGVLIGVGWAPALGLDLEGGVSVTLQPVEDGKTISEVASETLQQTKEIIERRINALGLVEPDVSIQGSVIVVQIPGIDDQQRALDLVGKTAELRFRPVLSVNEVPTSSDVEEAKATVKELSDKLGLPDGVTADQVYQSELIAQGIDPTTGQPINSGDVTTSTIVGGATDTTVGGATDTTVGGATDTTAGGATDTTAGETATTAAPAGTGSGGGQSALLGRQDTTTTAATTTTAEAAPTTAPTDPVPTSTTTPEPQNEWGVDINSDDFKELAQAQATVAAADVGVTSPEDDVADAQVTLDGREQTTTDPDTGKKRTVQYRYTLGPTMLTGKAIDTASSGVGQNGEWEVRPVFKDGADGIDLFNVAAQACNTTQQNCPTKQLAIVLDSVVLTAPSINEASFVKDQIQISGAFTQQEANDVALALKYGALPLTFEPQQVQTVSATLGQGALRAALLSGALGLILVLIYLAFMYRMLAVITTAGLILSGGFLWIVTTLSSQWFGGTLSLAGVVGIIVSIGVSLDSNVVYFETLKDDVLAGRGLKSATDRSFDSAFSTIVKADMSSLIGSAVLWVLSVGPIKGFAFYLGVSTFIDLITSYFFMHPGVAWLAGRKTGESPRRFGIPVSRSEVAS